MSHTIHFKHRNIAPVRSLGVLLFFLLFSSSTCDNPQCLREELDDLKNTTKEILDNQKKDSDALKDIKDRLTAIEQKLGTLSPGDLDTIKQDLIDLQNQFNQLDNDKADKSAINNLNQLFANMQTQISALETWKNGIETWKNSIDALQTAFNDLKPKQVGEEINLLQDRVKKLDNDAVTNKAELESKIQSLQQEVNRVESSLGSTITTLDNAVKDLNTKLEDLKKTVNALHTNLSSLPKLKEVTQDVQKAATTTLLFNQQILKLKMKVDNDIAIVTRRIEALERHQTP